MNPQDFQVNKRSLTFTFYRGQPQYQCYIETLEWYKSNPELHLGVGFHSESLENQHRMINQQLQLAILFIRSKGGLSKAEPYICYMNDFIAGQAMKILQVQQLSLRIVKLLNTQHNLKQLISSIDNCDTLVSYLGLEQMLSGSFAILEYVTTQLNADGTVSSSKGIWKQGQHYQGLYCQQALTLCKKDGKVHLALVNVRNNGKLLSGVTEKWLGKTLQQYGNWAVQFNNASTNQIIELSDANVQQIDNWITLSGYEDAQLALRELLRLCDICYKYCSMRQQFKTTDDGEQERRVITYQVTTERILTALSFGTLYYLATVDAKSEYASELKAAKPRLQLNRKFAEYYICYIMQSVVRLAELIRESLGGYGFLRFSGAPQIQEKLIWLSKPYLHDSDTKLMNYLNVILDFKNNKMFVAHYLGQMALVDSKQMFDELGPLTFENCKNAFHTFGYHAARIAERIQQKEFVSNGYSAFQMGQLTFELFVSQKLFNIIAFRRYRESNYVLDRLMMHQNFQALQVMETDLQVIKIIKETNRNNMRELLSVLDVCMEAFEFNHVDLLLGCDNPEQFYKDLVHLSKHHNHRNDESVLNNIREPILNLLNRPQL